MKIYRFASYSTILGSFGKQRAQMLNQWYDTQEDQMPKPRIVSATHVHCSGRAQMCLKCFLHSPRSKSSKVWLHQIINLWTFPSILGNCDPVTGWVMGNPICSSVIDPAFAFSYWSSMVFPLIKYSTPKSLKGPPGPDLLLLSLWACLTWHLPSCLLHWGGRVTNAKVTTLSF